MMESTSRLIVSAALHYRAEDLRVFLRSAARHVPDASVLLFTENGKKGYRLALEAEHPGVRLVRPPGIERRLRLWRSRRRRRKLRRIPSGRGRLNALLLETPLWARACAPLHIVMARYFWASWALGQPENRRAEKVLVCDSRDVCFQADPFVALDSELTVGCESVYFWQRPRGLGWIRRRYPDSVTRGLEDRPVISSGATLGTRNGIRNYLAGMKREIRRHAPTLYGRNGDQRIHNALLYRLYEEPANILPAINPVMAHLYGAQSEDYRLDAEGLKTPEGELIALLHLYEAIPELEERIRETYGARSGEKTDLGTGRASEGRKIAG